MKLTTAAALNNVNVSLIRLCGDIKNTEESFTENLSNDVISKIKLLSRAGRWLYLHLSPFVLSLTHTHTHTHTHTMSTGTVERVQHIAAPQSVSISSLHTHMHTGEMKLFADRWLD